MVLALSFLHVRTLTNTALLTVSIAFTCLLQESLIENGLNVDRESLARLGAVYCSILLFAASGTVALGKMLALPASATPSLRALGGKKGIGCALSAPSSKGCIYLDYNGTTPVFPEVSCAMLPYLGERWGNPSSGHAFGRMCKEGVANARRQVADALGCFPDEVIFVSCGTEADNWAIAGAIRMRASYIKSGKPHVVASEIEHPAVLQFLEDQVQLGTVDVTLVPVSGEGTVSIEDVEKAITPSTVLVTIMHSNNEVGSLQPIEAISALCASRGILCHTDAAQSVGKVSVNMHSLGVSFMTAVGHKFGAPKGVAVLCVSRTIEGFPSMLLGGGQESGRRAGTECTLLISGIGVAAELVSKELTATAGHMRTQRDSLLSCLLNELGPFAGALSVLGPKEDGLRLPNTLAIAIRGVDASKLLQDVGNSVAASAGAACHSHTEIGSAVLRAMKVDPVTARGFIRFSVGRHTTSGEVRRAAKVVAAAIQSLLHGNVPP
jgi:cysteine desulfurase